MAKRGEGIVIRDAHFPGRAPIEAYGDGGFRFADMSHRGSLLCVPSGIYGFAATSMVDLKLLLAQLQRNGYEVEVLAQELFRWEDMYYDDLNYVAVANQLQCYVHDHKHRRLERVSAVRATLKPPMRRRRTTQRPAHSEAHHRTES